MDPRVSPIHEVFPELVGNSEEIIEKYTHCVVCGANLHFTHLTDFVLNLTQEVAQCPECGIQVRHRTHKLQ